MTHRPFHERSLPDAEQDSQDSLEVLLAECQVELELLNQMSPVKLGDVKRLGGDEVNRLKQQYQTDGLYSQAFIERQNDLWLYLFRTHRQLGKAFRVRGFKGIWDAFRQLCRSVNELDSNVGPDFNSLIRPDNISDALSQGIGVRKYL